MDDAQSLTTVTYHDMTVIEWENLSPPTPAALAMQTATSNYDRTLRQVLDVEEDEYTSLVLKGLHTAIRNFHSKLAVSLGGCG